MSVEQRLWGLGVTLPQPAAPVANYVPWVKSGSHLYISGQLPLLDGTLAYSGKVGAAVSIEDATDAARLCGVNLIAQAKAALGSLEKVRRVVKLGAFVNSASDFTRQPQVANGASDLMVTAFGEAIGRHARSAVGVNVLPLDAAVEIDAVFEVDPD